MCQNGKLFKISPDFLTVIPYYAVCVRMGSYSKSCQTFKWCVIQDVSEWEVIQNLARLFNCDIMQYMSEWEVMQNLARLFNSNIMLYVSELVMSTFRFFVNESNSFLLSINENENE
jgi:hypothetical protein